MALHEEVTFEIEEFPIMVALRHPGRAERVLRKHYRWTGRFVGIRLSKWMRDLIRGAHPGHAFAPNAEMTKELKRSSKPLIDQARLFKSATHRERGDWNETIEVGVLRTSGSADVARIVHDGAKILVTRRMARLFHALYLITSGRDPNAPLTSSRGFELLQAYDRTGGVAPRLIEGTTLVIPPRQFASVMVRDPELKRFVEKAYSTAIKEAIHELSIGRPTKYRLIPR